MCQQLTGHHLKLCPFQINCFFMGDFIRDKWLNSFPKLLTISYRTDVNVSKIILLVLRKKFKQ